MTNPVTPSGLSISHANSTFLDMAFAKDLPASILSEPLKVFEGGHPIIDPVVAGSTSATPRGAIYSNVDPSFKANNRFRFHYNPSSISISTAWDLSKPAFGATTDPSGGGGAVATIGSLGGVNAPESLSFQIVLNRIVEASNAYTGPWADLFHNYGTIGDLSVFFRTINAATDKGIQAIIDSGPDTPIPPSNPGYLIASNCKLLFGVGYFVWFGYCTSVSVNHAKFINSMTPVLSTIDVTFQRTLSTGDTNAAESSSASSPSLDTKIGKDSAQKTSSGETKALTTSQLSQATAVRASSGKVLKP